MAGVVRYGTDSAEAAVSGMAAMTDVLNGYIQGDMMNYDRYKDARDFDESVRRYDTDFAERQRQFDTTLDWTAEQNQLNREHDIYLQDDAQDWQSVESQKQRDWQGEENDAFRAVDYYRIKKDVEMRNLDRGLQYRSYYLDDMAVALGGYNSYDEIPDYAMRTTDGQILMPGRDFDVVTELSNIAAGKGSTVVNLPPDAARALYDQVVQGKITKEQAAAAVAQSANNIVVNNYKEDAVQKLMLQRVGNDPAMLASMTEQQLGALRNAVIHDMNNYQPQRKKFAAEQIDFYAQQRNVDAGVAPGGVGANDVNAMIAQQNQQYFKESETNNNFPSYSGYGSPMVGRSMQRMQGIAVDVTLAEERITDPAKYEEYKAQRQKELAIERNNMIELGVPADQAEWFYNATIAAMNGEWDPSMWSSAPKGVKIPQGQYTPMGTADGATRSSPAPGPNKGNMIQTRYGWLPRDKAGLQPGTPQYAAVDVALAQEAMAARSSKTEESTKKELEMRALEYQAQNPELSYDEALEYVIGSSTSGSPVGAGFKYIFGNGRN